MESGYLIYLKNIGHHMSLILGLYTWDINIIVHRFDPIINLAYLSNISAFNIAQAIADVYQDNRKIIS